MCCGEERWTKGEGSSGGCMTRQQVASTMKTVERGGYRIRVIVSECARGKMGVIGCLRGAGRCVQSDIPIAGAGAGWACAHEARVMLKGKSAVECCQQGFRNILLRWPTIYCE